ncbi:MAG: hypothetical protein EBX71_12040, partial [Betaproteobacteria bacterium]|nr:hypothetical protein [Betaproteobacteria bacterium]
CIYKINTKISEQIRILSDLLVHFSDRCLQRIGANTDVPCYFHPTRSIVNLQTSCIRKLTCL